MPPDTGTTHHIGITGITRDLLEIIAVQMEECVQTSRQTLGVVCSQCVMLGGNSGYCHFSIPWMKKIIFVTFMFASALAGGGCSKSDTQTDTASPSGAKASLRADAERLRQATARAAEERKRAQAQGTPTPGAANP